VAQLGPCTHANALSKGIRTQTVNKGRLFYCKKKHRQRGEKTEVDQTV